MKRQEDSAPRSSPVPAQKRRRRQQRQPATQPPPPHPTPTTTAMMGRHRQAQTAEDAEDAEDDTDTHSSVVAHPHFGIPPLPPLPTRSPSSLLALPSTASRRSISMGDFRRVTGVPTGSEPPSASTTAPSSRLVTPSSSMEFQAARRRLLEVEERQRVIREMERRLEELREVFVRSEQEAVVHGELVSHIAVASQQGELIVAENSKKLKKGLRFRKHRPTIVFSSMLGLRTCLPWPVKLK